MVIVLLLLLLRTAQRTTQGSVIGVLVGMPVLSVLLFVVAIGGFTFTDQVGWTAVACGLDTDPRDITRCARRIGDETHRLSAMVEDLFELSRSVSGDADAVLLVVQDSCGEIPEHELPLVFDTAFRGGQGPVQGAPASVAAATDVVVP